MTEQQLDTTQQQASIAELIEQILTRRKTGLFFFYYANDSIVMAYRNSFLMIKGSGVTLIESHEDFKRELERVLCEE